MTTSDKPIDVEQLVARCLGDSTFVREILGVFHDQAKVHLALLRQKIAAGDAEGTRRVAHAMRGSAANLSAGRLSELCGSLEDSAHGESLPDPTDKVNAIIAELDRCVAFFPTIDANLK